MQNPITHCDTPPSETEDSSPSCGQCCGPRARRGVLFSGNCPWLKRAPCPPSPCSPGQPVSSDWSAAGCLGLAPHSAGDNSTKPPGSRAPHGFHPSSSSALTCLLPGLPSGGNPGATTINVLHPNLKVRVTLTRELRLTVHIMKNLREQKKCVSLCLVLKRMCKPENFSFRTLFIPPQRVFSQYEFRTYWNQFDMIQIYVHTVHTWNVDLL